MTDIFADKPVANLEQGRITADTLVRWVRLGFLHPIVLESEDLERGIAVNARIQLGLPVPQSVDGPSGYCRTDPIPKAFPLNEEAVMEIRRRNNLRFAP